MWILSELDFTAEGGESMAREQRKAIQCTLKHHVGQLRQSDKGWSREVNVISWEGAASRLDIRDWSQNKERSSKGITFTRSEVEKLKELLSILDTSVIEDTGVSMRLQAVQVHMPAEDHQITEAIPFEMEAEGETEPAPEERAAI